MTSGATKPADGHIEDEARALAEDLLGHLRWACELNVPGFEKNAPVKQELPNPAIAAPELLLGEEMTSLAALQTALEGCTRCPLHENRSRIVFGTGNPRADLCLVGEGPGEEEDLRGEPFVGAAGQLLDRIIEAMGLKRGDVYICNIVKCRPPRNRTPLPEEMEVCGPFVARQIELVSPKMILTLGATATQYLLGVADPISRLRGRFHEWRGIPLRATYHPAYLLRSPKEKRKTWEDVQAVMQSLGLKGKAP